MNRACVVALASGLAVSVVSANDIQWASPVDGFWNVSANWSPATVPTGAADVAILGLSGPYTVEFNQSAAIDGLSITNPEAVFEITAGRSLTLGSSGLYNDGWVIINPTSQGFVTSLSIGQPSILDGSGLLSLNSSSSTARINSGTDALLTHGVNHTINGFGRIELRFDNAGYIVGDAPGQEIFITGGDKANSGVIAATDGGRIAISNTLVDQTAGGILEANGGEVAFTGSTVIGGTLLNSGTPGSLISVGSTTLDAVTINGDAQQPAGNTVNIAGGSLVNNGTLLVNPTGAGFVTSLNFTGSTLINGDGMIRLNAPSNTARMIGAGISVENGADHTIRGHGMIFVDLINSGLVAADTTGQVLELTTGNKTNLAALRSENGGELRISNTTMTQSATGEIIADGGSVTLAANTVIVEGSLRNLMSPGSIGVVSSTTTLEDVAIEGDWSLNAGVTLTVRGTMTNDGIFTINPTGQGFVTSMSIPEDATLTGSGVLRLNSPSSTSRVISTAGEQLTQGADHSIRGFGQISALMLNNGLVAGDVDDRVIQIDGQTKVNNSVFRAEGGGGLQIQSTTIDQTGGGVIEADGGAVSFTSTTVLGGNIINTGAVDSSVAFSVSTLQNCAITGDSVINAGGVVTIAGGSLTNNGVLTVNETGQGFVTSLSSGGVTVIDGIGEIRLNSNAATARLLNAAGDVLTLGSGQTLSGIGQIAAETQIDGTLEPGLSVGTMTGTRAISLTDTAVFACEFNDEGAADQFSSTAAVTLDGTLDISFIDGYTASSPEAFTIITTGNNGLSGRFDAITGDAPPAPLVTRVVYESNRVRIGFVCPADANLDGSTDLGDLNAILANFGTNASLGDVTGDGAVNLADLNLVLANFGVDCQD